MPTEGEIWVIDTSSITEVRRCFPKPSQKLVYARLEVLVEAGHIIFPKEVQDELERAINPKLNPDDLPLAWCRRVSPTAISNPAIETVKAVLARVPTVLDPDKVVGPEEADPYVLARAVELKREGREACIITQEKNDKPNKLSLSSAAGILKLPAVTVIAFLQAEGLMP